MRAWAATALVLVACAGCTKKEPRGPGRILSLDTDVVGLSGLSVDEHGALWAPGERGDAVLRIDPASGAVTRYPAVGVPGETDLEALTWIDGARFALGTETQEKGRTRDVVLDGHLEDERFVVRPSGHVDYARWQLTARDNHGIEGMCRADRVLLFAMELVEERDGRRWAPVGVFDPAVQAWTAHRLALTSDTGKLAALDCRVASDGGIEALAVERHYGVSRLLRFRVPRGPEAQSIEAHLSADLAKLVDPLPNFEGLAWLQDGSVALVTDNRFRGPVTEPSRVYFVPASALR